MITLEYTEEITNTGLSRELAVVYEALLKLGESPASTIAKAIPNTAHLSRPLVYKVLEELITLDLAEKHAPKGKVATFLPKHPVALSKAIDKQKEKFELAKKQFLPTSGKLSSLFNLMSGKPGVQFFEGEDGVWEVMQDSLTATSELFSYADIEAIAKYIPELNAEYGALREDKNIKKRVLAIDSPKARSFLSAANTENVTLKLIKASDGFVPFQTIMHIYDQKITYVTLTDQYLVGIIITDQHIANTHRYLFESMWNSINGEKI